MVFLVYSEILIFEYVVSSVEEYSYNNIKIDVLSTFDSAKQMYVNNNYKKTGKYHSSFREIPFICYERNL